jgi:hypothetical protein
MAPGMDLILIVLAGMSQLGKRPKPAGIDWCRRDSLGIGTRSTKNTRPTFGYRSQAAALSLTAGIALLTVAFALGQAIGRS